MIDEESSQTVSRRTLLQGAAVASAGALAGCSLFDDNDSTGDSAELGEQVPPIEIHFPTDIGSWTAFFENSLPTWEANLEEALNLDVELVGRAFSSINEEERNNDRAYQFNGSGHSMRPSRLDPNELMMNFHILNAGANGRHHGINWPNCEYSKAVSEQSRTPDQEERQELITKCNELLTDAVGHIPICEWVVFSAYRTDMVELGDPGSMGFSEAGFYPLFDSEAVGDAEQLIMNTQPRVVENTTFVYGTGASEIYPLANTLYSPLFTYDANFEHVPVLAEDYQISDDNLTTTVNLRDATFHNGDPITAEDVKWSYEFGRQQANEGNWPEAPQTDFESIEAVDEKTVEFVVKEPAPTLLTVDMPSWGILPKDLYIDGGAEDDPTNFDDPRIGSGPFKFGSWEQGSFIALEPYEDHPTIEPASDLVFQAIGEAGTAFRSFREGDINLLQQTTGDFANEIEEELSDVAETVETDGFTTVHMRAQCDFGPTKFREFRKAASQLINRQDANQVGLYGKGNPAMYATPLGSSHPWFADDNDFTQLADSPSANLDAAKKELEAEGWGWDENGNLRYPPDADLTPLWPDGSEPAEHSDEYPCVDEWENPP